MKITQAVMKEAYEKTIDDNIEVITKMQSEGLKNEKQILLLDACLKYVILTSEIRADD